MLATTTTVRKMAKALYGQSWGYAGTYTDKAADGTRLVAFKVCDKQTAEKLAADLQAALTAAGYTNAVKATRSDGDWNAYGCDYVRVRAVLG